MKKLLILSVISFASVFGALTGSASAWHYSVSGKGACQDDGSYKITWMVDNTSEPSALEVSQSSNTDVVANGTTVAARQSKDFEQTVDGTKAGSYKLELVADWKEDRKNMKQSATVELKEACEQPEVPEEPETPEVPETPEEPQVLPSTGAGSSAILAFVGVSTLAAGVHNVLSRKQ